jgi:glycosyltransferase involved in cell wall biosynthesis
MAPSQRFRFEQYFQYFKEKEIAWEVAPFWSRKGWSVLYANGKYLQKLAAFVAGYLRRLGLLFVLHRYDRIVVHREAAPLGPPVFEWIMAKVLRQQFVYDFDDAIWMANTSNQNKLVASLKYHSKVSNICAWAGLVSCGNSWLAAYARQYNHLVEVMPTTIDTAYHMPAVKTNRGKLIIGWTGTHSTAPYLELIRDVLRQLADKVDMEFLVISNLPPDNPDAFWRFERWDRNREIGQLQQLDIGVMPLEDSAWEKGKCGFKALQYMALSIPAVVSPVGVNTEIIRHGASGFLCGSSEQWYDNLLQLAKDDHLRMKIGQQGRETVKEKYSSESQKERFFSLLLSG